METRIESSSDEAQVERAKDYRSKTFLSGVESRAFGVEYHWSHHMRLRDLGDATLARGAFRASLDAAIGLAAKPTEEREAAMTKVQCLRRTRERLTEHPTGCERLGVARILAAAERIEVDRWDLRDRERARDSGVMGALWFELGDDLSPGLRRSYARLAGPVDLASALLHVDAAYSDFGALRADGDMPAAAGALDDLRVAALRVMATPVESIVGLEARREFLDHWSEVFEPAELLRPMVEAMVMDDCRRVGATPDMVDAVRAVLPGGGCEKTR